jgi:hypothetical protein
VSGLSRELLHDSEVTLRLVDDLVTEISEQTDDEVVKADALRLLERLNRRRVQTREIESLFVRMYAELQRILYSVRKSRGLLEEAALQHLESTNAKLKEVSSATEFAATNMLDGVDRALSLVGRIEDEPDDEAAFEELREELHALVVALQFQDITSQQIEHASAVIVDLETQLRRVTEIFARVVIQDAPDDLDDEDPPKPATGGNGNGNGHATYDPEASVSDASSRQAVADDIFGPG